MEIELKSHKFDINYLWFCSSQFKDLDKVRKKAFLKKKKLSIEMRTKNAMRKKQRKNEMKMIELYLCDH